MVRFEGGWHRFQGILLAGGPVAVVCWLSVFTFADGDERNPRRVFNDDAQFLFEMPEAKATEFVRSWLDKEMAAVPFTTYVFLAATPDICTFESQAGETAGDRFDANYRHGWVKGIRHLRSEGTDALRVVTEHMHAHGKEVLAAIRMGDTHHSSINPANAMCPQFAIDNPQFVIVQPDGRTNETALDYSYAEVREHRLGIMREIVEQYDVDGLELNFVRWAKHFPRDQGREKAVIMTSFIGEIKAMLQDVASSKGRQSFTLGVRVPESLDACWLAGVDVETWVKQKWVDYIVVSTWNNTDPQLGVEQFARFAQPAKVDVIVTMGNMIGCIDSSPPIILDRPVAMSAKHAKNYQGMLLNASEARGAAANFFAWGADSISFWNVGIQFGARVTAAPAQQKRITQWTQAVSSLDSIYAGPRTYRYLPMGKGMSTRKPPVRNYPWSDEGRSPLGHVNSPVLEFPATSQHQKKVFPFRMADGRHGESLRGLMTFWIYRLESPRQMSIAINDESLAAEAMRVSKVGLRRGGVDGYRFEINLSECPKLKGNNELALTLETPNVSKAHPYLEELEVIVTAVQRGDE